MTTPSVGVYLHVPFCERVCPYCDFAVVAARPLAEDREARYVAALLCELADARDRFAGRRLDSVYLGGGTPALLGAASVARLLDAVTGAFRVADALEVTLEVNPSSVERSRLADFRKVGVNRLSIGVQSFDDGTLKRLGRAHRGEEVWATLAAARAAGFANLSVDLMHAVPGQTLADTAADVASAVRFGPEHISCYALTLEEGTPFGRAAQRDRLRLPSEETAAAMWEHVREALAAAGYLHYELSSHARPGFESRHNRRYWERTPVLGLGVGAWSSEPASPGAPHGARRANPRDLESYLERALGGQCPSAGAVEALPAAVARGEAIFLALRTARGLDAAIFAAEFGDGPRAFKAREIDALRKDGLLIEAPNGDLRLTPRGQLFSDSVFAHFV